MGSKFFYKNLNPKEKVRRNAWISLFSLILIYLLFATDTFSTSTAIFFTVVLVIVGLYQSWRDYRNWKSFEQESNPSDK